MKTLLALLFATTLLLPNAVNAADFEGVVTMKMTGPRGTPQQMTFSLAKGRSRIDVPTPEGGAAMLFDQAKDEMILLMPQQKMYMVQPVATAAASASAVSDASSVEKTGETEKILGYTCSKYLTKGRDGTTEIWATNELGAFMGMGSGGNPMGGPGGGRRGARASQAWEEAFRGKNAFPLRVVTRASDGKESFRMEATAVEKKSLPASTFEPPADFQKFDMGAMMQGMGMPPGMRPPSGG